MGLLRDAIGSAMGPRGVKNGFGGLPIQFGAGCNQQSQRQSNLPYSTASSDYDYRYQDWRDFGSRLSPNVNNRGASCDQYVESPNGSPPPYSARDQRRPHASEYQDRDQEHYNSMSMRASPRRQAYSGQSSFRPVALPTTGYSDGEPFLRGYSHELQQYGISRTAFISIVDAINKAIVPNPELQILQKGANIAGWFLPGAESIGLMGGQIIAGVGGAYFHNSGVNKVLAKANLDVFVPQGLEICIGSSQDVDNEAGEQCSQQDPSYGASPVQKLRAYGNLLAPLDEVLPPAQNQGRNDPLAMYGRNISRRNEDKKSRNAQRALARGRVQKVAKMEQGMKWLIVRQASDQAIDAWQKVLQQSNADLAQSQTLQPARA